MTVVQGAFNKLLKPGLTEAFHAAYDAAAMRTGVYDIFIGVPDELTGLIRLPLHISEPYPPTDWPDYP